jgi:hypothetical protein
MYIYIYIYIYECTVILNVGVGEHIWDVALVIYLSTMIIICIDIK